ncbi:hypothetical protein [Rhizobium aegyptiacum]|uniref:hypothetical protein n=1 Tax=Rhizobium aegyptiacum TaxID=1764550 RepID=UPI000A5AEDD0|nr:hypothetical protein [Rhizobium aegyptiacum]
MTRISNPVLEGKSIGEIDTYMDQGQQKSVTALLIAQTKEVTFGPFRSEGICRMKV